MKLRRAKPTEGDRTICAQPLEKPSHTVVADLLGPRLVQEILVNALGCETLVTLGEDKISPGGTAARLSRGWP